MRTIVYIIDSLAIGGAEKSTVEIAIRLKSFKPVFVYLFSDNSLEGLLKKNGIEVFALGIARKNDYKTAQKKLYPLLKIINPDIVHSILFRADLITRRIKRDFEFPLVSSLVSNSYKESRYSKLSLSGKMKLRFIQLIDKFTTSKVDLFISNSYSIKKDNARKLKINNEKIIVIPRGRELTDFENLNSLQLKIGENSVKKILNIGRLIESKGQLDLIRAFSKVEKKVPNVVLLIAGEGPYRNRLEDEIKKLQIHNKVFLLGTRNDIPELLFYSDLFVFPSYLEGLPGSIIEAMMARTPIVASDIPENLECVDEETASIFPVGNVECLAETIINSLERSREDLKSSKAFNIAVNKFNINRIVEEYEKTYSGLLKED